MIVYSSLCILTRLNGFTSEVYFCGNNFKNDRWILKEFPERIIETFKSIIDLSLQIAIISVKQSFWQMKMNETRLSS